MANTKLPARLLDTSAIPALNVTGDLTVDTTTLKVDSTNNRVGIGTASPGAPLSISNLDNGTSFSSNRVLQLIGTSTTDGSRVSLAFTGNTSIGNGLAIIEAVNDDQSAGHTSLHMHTYNGSWNTENLVLKGGNVGIGVASPKTTLNIGANDSGQGPILTLENTDTSITTGDVIGQIDFYANDGSSNGTGPKVNIKAVAQSSAGTVTELTFGTSPSSSATAIERMRIDASGNVGIGTNNPTEKLHLGGTAPGDSIIRQDATSSGTNWEIGERVAGKYQFWEDDGDNVRLTIMSTGNVGIAHTSPKSKLSIVGDGSLNTYSGTIGIENTANDKWASITLTDDIDTASASSNYYLIGRGSTYADRYMSFHVPTAANYGSGSQPKFVFASTGSDELFTVEASTGTAYYKGNVGIGDTSPNVKLSVGAGNASTYVHVNNAATGDVSSGYNIISGSTTTSSLYGNAAEGWTTLLSGGALNFRVNNAVSGFNPMGIDTSGRVTMPSQPGFKIAWGGRNATGSGRILSTGAGDSQASGRDQHNTGNHFSVSTGRFTAPVAGTYLLGFQGMRNGSNGTSLECRIKKNGAFMWARAYQAAFDQSHQYWAIVTITNCAVNDYFEVYIGPSTSIYDDDTYFYGHLLG